MTTYADLTIEQQTTLDDFMALIRPLAGEIAKTCNHMGAANTAYAADIDVLIASLGEGEVVPNKSGLAGAQSMKKEDVQSFMGSLALVLSTYNTDDNREQWSKLAGANNLIG